MDSLIFELQIVFYFQLFLSANVRHTGRIITLAFYDLRDAIVRHTSSLVSI